MRLRKFSLAQLYSVGGAKAARRVSRFRTIGGTQANARVGSANYRTNADAVLAYLCKAASHDTGEELALPRSGEVGPIVGKRVGWTQNIGKSLRLAYLKTEPDCITSLGPLLTQAAP